MYFFLRTKKRPHTGTINYTTTVSQGQVKFLIFLEVFSFFLYNIERNIEQSGLFMPRIMGIDFGDVRIGIAISDEQAFLAGEAFTVRETNFEKAVTLLCDLIDQREIKEIALGFPKNMDGTVGERGEKSKLLASLLTERTGVPVQLWDE